MSKKTFYLLVLLIGSGLIFLGYAVGTDWKSGSRASLMIYGVLVTLFLAAQLWGFVVSQMVYVDHIEKAKFEVLEIEGIKSPSSDVCA